MKKGFYALLLAGSMMGFSQFQVHAAEITEIEENDSSSDAQFILNGDTIIGNIGDEFDEDYYAFDLDKTSKVTIKINNLDHKGGFLWGLYDLDDENYPLSNSENVSRTETTFGAILPAGSYFIRIENDDNGGKYSITETANPIPMTTEDYHDSPETAFLLKSGEAIYDSISTTEDYGDVYQLELNHKQKVHLDFTNTEQVPGFSWEITGEDDEEINSKDLKMNGTTSYSAILDKGIYYININNDSQAAPYSLKATTFDDIKKPVIQGAKSKTIKRKSSFNSLKGITVTDEHDGDITDKLKVSGKVNTHKKRSYKLTYKATDAAGNIAKKTIKIRVK